MGKVIGSYENVTGGVSEQVPQDRRPGQHYEQVNFISDPVKGLARRPGSVFLDETYLDNYTPEQLEIAHEDCVNFKEYTFFVDGDEYSVIYRAKRGVAGTPLNGIWVFNKDTKKFLTVQRPAVDPTLDVLLTGGASAMVNIGKYVLIAGNEITPQWTPDDRFNGGDNPRNTAFWVRGGTYSRTFRVYLTKSNGTIIELSYKTKASSYPGVLDTSDIPYDDTQYTKKVTDRTNAYNTAVTQWIGEASADIQPENIAEKLRLQAVSLGVTGAVRYGSHIAFTQADDIIGIRVDDSGDGSYIRGVANELSSPDKVSLMHYVGKIIRIKPEKSTEEDSYYLEASPKIEGETGFKEVIWRESVGYKMTPVEVLSYATVKNGVFYIASSASLLDAMTGETAPVYSSNQVGDSLSCVLPNFFGKRINYLGVFQDRLAIGSGSVLFFSKPGDYLNWWRTSVLTVQDDDPVELYALGSEDDTIVCSTTYDRNIVFFGKRKQYVMSGRQPLTPSTASIVTLSSYEGTVDAFVVNASNFVFYAKHHNSYASMHQIQMGLLADSPESYEISKQLVKYLEGVPCEIVAITSPNTIVLRTSRNKHGFYLYSYLDTAASQERLFDAWSRWEWDAKLGTCIGVINDGEDIVSYTLRNNDGDGKTWICADSFSLDPDLSDRPYIDSLRKIDSFFIENSQDFWSKAHQDQESKAIAAFDSGTVYKFLGTPYNNIDTFLEQYPVEVYDNMWVGITYPTYVTPTNPHVRDRNGKAIVTGRLTLTKILASLTNSGGLEVFVQSYSGYNQVLDFNARVIGESDNLVGRQAIITKSIAAFIGKETRECRYTLKARDWLPLTITAIEWVGQYFNNSRRV